MLGLLDAIQKLLIAEQLLEHADEDTEAIWMDDSDNPLYYDPIGPLPGEWNCLSAVQARVRQEEQRVTELLRIVMCG